MLEDYIKYHDIKFELIGGLYWKNSDYTTLYQCFENLERINNEVFCDWFLLLPMIWFC